ERNTGCVAALRFTRGWRKFRNNARPRLVRSAVPLSNGLSMGDNAAEKVGFPLLDHGPQSYPRQKAYLFFATKSA
ncbi:hypothetical protein, partial [Paraburkholderia sp. BR10954]|uniref:hypothetical protein n=1 Tax=Paraburkholderia sp. BR10954 TaxID=3236995 RepID=UPI0034D20FBB